MFLLTCFSLPCSTMNHAGLIFCASWCSPDPARRGDLSGNQKYEWWSKFSWTCKHSLPCQALVGVLFVCLLVCFNPVIQHIPGLCFGIYTGLNTRLSQDFCHCAQSQLHHRTCWTCSCYKHLSSKTPNISPDIYIFRAMFWLILCATMLN